jgi:hypothetical protein
MTEVLWKEKKQDKDNNQYFESYWKLGYQFLVLGYPNKTRPLPDIVKGLVFIC